MPLRCPECREALDAGGACPRGHRFEEREGVLALLGKESAQRLDEFTRAIERVRAAQGRRITDEAAYESLPFGRATAGDFHWRLRALDLAVVRRLLRGLRSLTILDVGAWNGWLSHRLAALGHRVTAIDYFVDPHDGLGARRFYSTTWRAIQMDLADLSLLDERFDVVVLNRCLQFAPDPTRFAAAALEKVAPGGWLVLTGLEIFRRPGAKAARVEAMLRAHRERYGFELFLVPTRGYLDRGDEVGLEGLGVRLRPYPRLIPANLLAVLDPSRPRHCYGVLAHRSRAAATLDDGEEVRYVGTVPPVARVEP